MIEMNSVKTFIGLYITIAFLGSFLAGGGVVIASPPVSEIQKVKVAQTLPCDFEVVVSEPKFCVVHGSVRDINVRLAPITGVCNGSADLRIRGFPKGVTKTLLPSPTMQFKKGKAVATVRIDTASVDAKRATSTLIFTASRGRMTRIAKAEMMIDLPEFDFSIKPQKKVLQFSKEGTATTTVSVEPLGGKNCELDRSVTLNVDASSLPSFIQDYRLSPDVIIPPGKATLFLKSGVSEEELDKVDAGIDIHMVELLSCCANEGDVKIKKSIKIGLYTPFLEDFMTPDEINDAKDDGDLLSSIEFQMDKAGEKIRLYSREELNKIANLPSETVEEERKLQEELATNGYFTVSEKEVQRLRNTKERLRPVHQVLEELAFEPASLKGTPFETLRLEGGYPFGAGLRNNQGGQLWTGIVRIFTTPNGAMVGLTEYDLGRDSLMLGSKEDLNEDVNGFPAGVTIVKSPSGRSLTSMGWTSTTKDYTLAVEGDLKKNGQYEFLLSLARSITEKSRKTQNSEVTDNLPPASAGNKGKDKENKDDVSEGDKDDVEMLHAR